MIWDYQIYMALNETVVYLLISGTWLLLKSVVTLFVFGIFVGILLGVCIKIFGVCIKILFPKKTSSLKVEQTDSSSSLAN